MTRRHHHKISKTVSVHRSWLIGIAIIVTMTCMQTSGASANTATQDLIEGQSTLESVLRNKKLVVLTRQSPTTYFTDVDGPAGFEHDLALSFGKYLGVSVEFKIADSRGHASNPQFTEGVDMIAAGFSQVQLPAHEYHFGPSYSITTPQVVCHRSGFIPDNLQQLNESNLILISNHHLNLHGIIARNIDIATNQSIEQVFAKITRAESGCTIANSDVFMVNRHYYPQLKVAFALNNQGNLAWCFKKNGKGLVNAAHHWFNQVQKNGDFAKLRAHYFGHTNQYDYVDNSRYHRRIASRLPKYRDLFIAAAERYDIPWTTLAAMSYQESHWNPRAISPTGVRGMMMLTLNTARSMGIKNRTDAKSSIQGGAQYLAWLIKRVPEEVDPQQRIWFAIAAYNVGYGHLQDARKITEQRGKNPNDWNDVSESLPLLTQEEIYSTLKYGYARGHEPVNYVKKIKYYRDILYRYSSLSIS